MVRFWTVGRKRNHEFEFLGGLLKAAKDGIHERFLIHDIYFGIAATAPRDPPAPQVTVEVGQFLLLELLVELLALLSLINLLHYI